MTARQHWIFLISLVLVLSVTAGAQSYFPEHPDDPLAVSLTKDTFPVHADGVGDDSDALQQAINSVEETTHRGIVFIPEGTYRLGKTVYVWEGIRLIGYGKSRPVFVLGRNTPGFEQGDQRYMVWFADRRPAANAVVQDASEFTFYSGINNIDFKIEEGNPAAIAIRFHVAQHSALVHMDFHIGSAQAAIQDIGNQASDIHVYGGQYGIITKRTAPVWQFLLMDSSFEGQAVAAIHTQEAGMTLVRDRFTHVPVAVEIAEGEVEQLYGRDLQLEDVRQAAVSLGSAKNPKNEVTLENVECTGVPTFVLGDQPTRASRNYVVERFSHGLDIGSDGREQGIAQHRQVRWLKRPAKAVRSDIPGLPPMSTWVNVHTLGVAGDGGADDTRALQEAIRKHRVLYFPSGVYRLTGSLTLKPDTVLIGLNPSTTELAISNGAPEFQGDGPTIPLLIAPKSGKNIVTGIGIQTGYGNPRAGGIIWMAGEKSLLEDVTFVPNDPVKMDVLAPGRPAPVQFDRAKVANYLGTQQPDLWVKDGGGGIFRDLWTHNTYSDIGLRVENTSTPSKIYQLSCEHHKHVEAQFLNVKNWNIFDLQTEEENPAGAEAIAAEIRDSQNLSFNNTYMYRVSRNVLPKTYAIAVTNSAAAFKNVKVFSQTRLAFDNAVLVDNGVAVRSRFLTSFMGRPGMKAPAALALPSVFAKNANLKKLATGFSNASSLTTDDKGNIFFSDAAMHKIYRWNSAERKAEVIGEIPGQPMVMSFVPPSTLLIVAYEKAVYSLDVMKNEPPQLVVESNRALANTRLLLPVGMHNERKVLNDMMEHRGYVYRQGSNTAIFSVVENEHRGYFYAPGTKIAIMAGGTWRPLLQSSQLTAFASGDQRLITSEDDERTYFARLKEGGTLSMVFFADRGGNSVVMDEEGNVYIASGQVYIYNRHGVQIGVLEVPERPGSLAFGGGDHRTLFIGARSSLYSIRTALPGDAK